MSTAFDAAFAHTVGVEGDFSNHPDDSGAATRFGITEKLARAYAYTGDMRDLPFDFARYVYHRHFWVPMRLDEVSEVSVRVAAELFDTGVNCGTTVAARFLQRSLNVLNRQQKDYGDISVDGLVGQMTLNALHHYLIRRPQDGEATLLRALNCLQGAYYIELAERREKDESFVFGWLRTRVVI